MVVRLTQLLNTRFVCDDNKHILVNALSKLSSGDRVDMNGVRFSSKESASVLETFYPVIDFFSTEDNNTNTFLQDNCKAARGLLDAQFEYIYIPTKLSDVASYTENIRKYNGKDCNIVFAAPTGELEPYEASFVTLLMLIPIVSCMKVNLDFGNLTSKVFREFYTLKSDMNIEHKYSYYLEYSGSPIKIDVTRFDEKTGKYYYSIPFYYEHDENTLLNDFFVIPTNFTEYESNILKKKVANKFNAICKTMSKMNQHLYDVLPRYGD